jgi:hypothetical protein
MSKIDRVEDCDMTNLKHVMGVGLAAATLVVVPFFAGGLLLLRPSFAPLVAQAGLVPGAVPAWFGPVFGIGAIVLAAGAFVLSWNQRSFLISGLLAVSGIIYMIPPLIALANINFAVIVIPGPILGFISGLAIFGLGVAKGLRTAKTAIAVAAR